MSNLQHYDITLTPVSYTHLDVYKRQADRRGNNRNYVSLATT